ncbi:MAG: AAA family ATPase [Weeping tea tree witches'-broom phytoplasma]|uniref:AAA family ATPase n=1 Tax=Candidatus Phytoplasma melaleucae TaxID=2982630 RepID=UPI00293A9522|nr:AAA family ATPase [Weeping tea tree witches'-broom phytoplasma]
MNSESRMPGDWPVRFGRGRIFAYSVFTYKYPSKCFYPHSIKNIHIFWSKAYMPTKVNLNKITNSIEIKIINEKIQNFKTFKTQSILLYGSSDSSTKLLAQAISQKYQVPFYCISFYNLLRKQIEIDNFDFQKFFQTINQNKPCILFVNKIQNLETNNNFYSQNVLNKKQAVNQILTSLKSLTKNSQILVISSINANENNLQAIEKIIFNSEIFDFKIHVRQHDFYKKQKILQIYDKHLLPKHKFILDIISKEIDILNETDLEHIWITIKSNMITQKTSTMNMLQIQEIVDFIAIRKKHKDISWKEYQKNLSYHHAGHILICLILNKMIYDSIKVDNYLKSKFLDQNILLNCFFSNYGKLNSFNQKPPKTQTQIIYEIIYYLSGFITEKIFLKPNYRNNSSYDDVEKVIKLIKKFRSKKNDSIFELIFNQKKPNPNKKITNTMWINFFYKTTTQIIEQNTNLIHKIAQCLYTQNNSILIQLQFDFKNKNTYHENKNILLLNKLAYEDEINQNLIIDKLNRKYKLNKNHKLIAKVSIIIIIITTIIFLKRKKKISK